MAERDTDGIVLIGMPGAGKSTVGVLLAKALGLGFEDTDLLIQTEYGETLQSILDREGYLGLRAKEECILLRVDTANRVVATGGSAVYSEAGMRNLAQAKIVYLDVPLPILRVRLDNLAERGVARPPEQSLEALYLERTVLYRRYADITLNANLPSADAVAAAIVARLKGQ